MKKRIYALAIAGVAVAAVTLINASWLAPPARGQTVLIAQRGMAQVFDRKRVDDDSCTARFIPPPTHSFIENTLPSMAAAFAAGADVVELDLSATADGEFVAFHDDTVDCRTNGTGKVAGKTLAELKALDAGYGHTADGGQTFPLRGTGIGLIPSLAEVLAAYPDRRFLIQLKRGPEDMVPRLVRYLDGHHADWTRLSFFGREDRITALRALRPDVEAWSEKVVARCSTAYLMTGWTGHVPKGCKGGMIGVALSQRWAAWGWPNRFASRMKANNVRILVIGGIDGRKSTSFWRVDTAKDVERLPKDFPAYVWTDHVETVGPLLKP